MKGQITTGSFYFRRKVRNKWVDAPVVQDVVVTVDNDGGLIDQTQVERRALRHIVPGVFENNCVGYELIKYELTGLDLGRTTYHIPEPEEKARPWET